MTADPWQVITDLASVLYRGGQDAVDVRREALGILERAGIGFDKLPAPELANGISAAPRVPRLRACVERWPECATGEYNPACCRFPKSCSAEVYDPDDTPPSDLVT
jgi:hypothetical protein